jgi:hypothetical protein
MRQAVAAAVRQRNMAVEELEEGTAEKMLVIERLRARVAAGEEVERRRAEAEEAAAGDQHALVARLQVRRVTVRPLGRMPEGYG